MWEREKDTSTTMFGQRSGDNQPDLQPDLHNITFAFDRGYWTLYLLFNSLLPWGADVVGTVMRCFWYPAFTCDKMDRVNTSPSEGL